MNTILKKDNKIDYWGKSALRVLFVAMVLVGILFHAYLLYVGPVLEMLTRSIFAFLGAVAIIFLLILIYRRFIFPKTYVRKYISEVFNFLMLIPLLNLVLVDTQNTILSFLNLLFIDLIIFFFMLNEQQFLRFQTIVALEKNKLLLQYKFKLFKSFDYDYQLDKQSVFFGLTKTTKLSWVKGKRETLISLRDVESHYPNTELNLYLYSYNSKEKVLSRYVLLLDVNYMIVEQWLTQFEENQVNINWYSDGSRTRRTDELIQVRALRFPPKALRDNSLLRQAVESES